MNENLKVNFERFKNFQGFIKVSDEPVRTLTLEQKSVLNRRGNVLFNDGNIESAARIFKTTGYSDGLSRVGDKYLEKNRTIDALKQYLLAHNKKKSESLCEKIALVISSLIESEENRD